MIPVKIQCGCGQKFEFEVEPAAGRMPWQANCPTCGTDQTNAANAIIARELSNQPPPLRIPDRSAPPFPSSDPELVGRHGTRASNPGRLRVDWAKAITTRPTFLILGIVLILFGLLVCCTVNPPWIGFVFVVTPFWMARRHYREVKRKFYGGDVCPAVVLSDKLVAVMTDLRVDSASRPAIKVMRYPLSKMTGGLPPVGSRVATVALYYGPPKETAWQNFSPEVIACWVTNENEIQRVTHSITEPEWRQLDALLSRIPKPEPGLYKMWGANAGKVKRAMDPGVEAVLAILILAGIFAGPLYAIVHQWKLKHPQQTANVAPAQPAETPAPETPDVAPPLAAPIPASAHPTVAAPAPPRPVLPSKPTPPTAIDLGGQIMTFTNLQGKLFENVRLTKADPRGGLIYSFDGGAGSVAFNTLPLDFLEQIGVPTNWPGVMQGRAVAGAPAIAHPPKPAHYAVGIERFNIIVHFTDPNSFVRNDLHVPPDWLRFAP